MFCFVCFAVAIVAVYALNTEFKSISLEAKNGLVSGLNYVVVKSIIVLPIFLLFSLCALGIPAFAIMNTPAAAAKRYFFIFAAVLFVFESFAELCSALQDDPILGMLTYAAFWCKRSF